MPSHATPSSAVVGAAGQSSGNISSAAAPAATTETPKSPAYKGYQSDILDGALQDYMAKSKEIGGPVAEHVSSFLSLSLFLSFSVSRALPILIFTTHLPARRLA